MPLCIYSVEVDTEGGIQGVDHEATLQRESHGGHTLAHPRGVDPIPVLDLGLIPKKYLDPVPDLPLGTGPHHYPMMETSRGAGHPLGPHLGDVQFHQVLVMEVQLVPDHQSPCNNLPGKVDCSYASEPVNFALCT